MCCRKGQEADEEYSLGEGLVGWGQGGGGAE